MRLSYPLPLIVPPVNVGTSTGPDHIPEVPDPDKSIGPSTVTDQSKSDGGSAISVTVKLLRGVRDSTNALSPLRSVAGGLCLILENCEVLPCPLTFNPQHLQPFQQTEVDGRAIELLAPRLKVLSGSLCTPILPGDVSEKEREKLLEQ